MPSGKDRLYVALHVRGGAATMSGKEDTYHWSLIVGPKTETPGARGMRYHVKDVPTPGGSQWLFEERDCALGPSNMLLVRVIVAKVENKDRLVTLLRNTPIRQGQQGWNCVGWVKEALERLKADGKAIGTSNTEWEAVREGTLGYCQRKKGQHRFDGTGDFDVSKVPTYDLVEQKELVS